MDPATAAFVRASFAAQGALAALGAVLTGLKPGWCELALPRSPQALQQHGYFHGGVIGALADSAGGYAGNSLVMPARECLTAEYKINLLSPARGSRLLARGHVIREGRTLIIAGVDVFVDDAGTERHCAVLQMTLAVIDARSTVAPSEETFHA